MTHDELNVIAAKWCKRPASGNGPGCQVALTEVGGLYGGERADVFAYRWGFDGGSVVVESKVSRSDFLADRAKPHRSGTTPSMGTYRYYICPEGLIGLDDLPDRWGLLWVNARGHVRVKAGHICGCLACGYLGHQLTPFWQHPADLRFELDMLAYALAKFADPEGAKKVVRKAVREKSRLASECDHLRQSLKKTETEAYTLRRLVQRYEETFGPLPVIPAYVLSR
ncbi:adenylosuccinate synthase [Rahnella perminowiae]|uniref:adenylosuccinate synthase n=1 Tax=Rahnella perminowiae TaxID=2816244 RepID=UPI00215BF309|nr:adenylosuccinate synthase [Rahnella perminowiae]MCR8998563.1 adenylosuccinate synthase [Rahnella perminowiae]